MNNARSRPAWMSRTRQALAQPAVWVICTSLAFVAYLGCGLAAESHNLYRGIDGNLYNILFHQLFQWSSPTDPTPINPFQGMGSVYLPFNIWINPGYLLLNAFENTHLQRWSSSWLFAVELYLSILLLARAFRLPWVATLIVAQGACVASFANPWRCFYMFEQFDLNPGVAHFVALGNVALAIFLWTGRRAGRQNLALVALLPIVWFYSMACEPMFHVVVFLPVLYFAGLALLMSESRREWAWKFGAIGLFAAINVAVGVPAFYQGLSNFPARQVFSQEIYGEVQDHLYVSLAYQPNTLPVFKTLLVCTLVLLVLGRWRERLGASLTLGHFAILAYLSRVYMYGDVNWTHPLPIYLEYGAYSVYAIVAALGVVRGCQCLRWTCSQILAHTTGWQTPGWMRSPAWRYAATLAFPLMATAGVFVADHRGPMSADAQESMTIDRSPIVDTLARTIELRPGAVFRGSVCTIYGESGSPLGARLGRDDERPFDKWQFAESRSYLEKKLGNAHALTHLWLFSIPTLEEYSQLVSPAMYYLMSRTLARPQDFVSRNFLPDVTSPNFGLLQSLGVRYMITDREPSTVPGKMACELPLENGLALRLYEFAEPNTGHYSPTTVHLARSADETVTLLRAEDFDFQREIVLCEPLQASLVAADACEMRFERCGVHVRASSPGTSLVLLPVQFSHALMIEGGVPGRSNVRLLRANLAQTAVLFDGQLDIHLAYRFGVAANHRARLADVRDHERLGLTGQGDRKLPPHLHPLALRDVTRD